MIRSYIVKEGAKNDQKCVYLVGAGNVAWLCAETGATAKKSNPTQLQMEQPLRHSHTLAYDNQFSLCQFTSFVTITYTKLTWQTYPPSKKKWKFLRQIFKYLLPLESKNLQLEQTKFPVFWPNFQIPSVFPDRDFFCGHFPCFLCAMGTLIFRNLCILLGKVGRHCLWFDLELLHDDRQQSEQLGAVSLQVLRVRVTAMLLSELQQDCN